MNWRRGLVLRGRLVVLLLVVLLLVGIASAALRTSHLVYLQANDEIGVLYDTHLEQIALLSTQQANINTRQGSTTARVVDGDKFEQWKEKF